MNTPAPKNDSDLLQTFAKKRNAQENKVALEAQKLINLYRQLSVFRPSFVNEFNKMLLESSKEVQMMMPSIVGGPTVRQYLEYLQTELNPKTTLDTAEQANTPQKGYLPDPEEDVPFEEKPQNNAQNLLSETINALAESSKTQALVLEQTLKEFKSSLQQTRNESGNIQPETLQKMQQETLEKTLEKMIHLQTNLFAKTVAELTKSLKEPVLQKETAPVRTAPHRVEYRPAQPAHAAPLSNKAAPQSPSGHSILNPPAFSMKKAPTVVPPIDDDIEILSEIDLSQNKQG